MSAFAIPGYLMIGFTVQTLPVKLSASSCDTWRLMVPTITGSVGARRRVSGIEHRRSDTRSRFAVAGLNRGSLESFHSLGDIVARA
jgi:hypothetical protein